MRKPSAERVLGAISGRKRSSGAMAPFALPITEVLVVADCWQTEADAEAVKWQLQRRLESLNDVEAILVFYE